MSDIKISIIQSKLAWEDKKLNLLNFESKINAIKEKTDLIVLPEMFNTAFSMAPKKFAESPLGTTHQWMMQMSAKKGAAIAGSYMVTENGKQFNRFEIVYPDGSFDKYDKRHLFRMGNEHIHFDEGDKELIFEYKGWKIKALICYDLRFPVFSKNTYHNGKYDYDILLYVANWPKVRDDIWRSLLKARAIENQAYVVAVNRVGIDGNGLDHWGSSCIIDAKGQYVIAPEVEVEFQTTATLSKSTLDDFRNKFTVGLDWDTHKIIN